MSQEEIATAASELLGLADERIGGADREWVTYDHAAAEAVLLVGACLEIAAEYPDTVLLLLTRGSALLPSLPLPTGLGEFRRRLWEEIKREGLAVPPAALLVLVA